VGMDDYVTKPVSRETLDKVVAKWLPHDLPVMVDAKRTEEEATQSDVHYNAAALKKRLNIDDGLINKLLDVSKVDMRDCLAEMNRHAGSKDLIAFNKTGHKLRGVAISLGFERLAQQAKRAEVMNTLDEKGVSKLVTEITEEVNTIVKLLGSK
jgi:HPt (histidine-containing phosphotransfer) domain-containing protein